MSSKPAMDPSKEETTEPDPSMGIKRVMDPSSVAVVGASKNPTKRGFQAIRTLLEDNFDGKIYPVNPKENSVLGLPCYPSVSSIEDPVDLVLITTPATSIPQF